MKLPGLRGRPQFVIVAMILASSAIVGGGIPSTTPPFINRLVGDLGGRFVAASRPSGWSRTSATRFGPLVDPPTMPLALRLLNVVAGLLIGALNSRSAIKQMRCGCEHEEVPAVWTVGGHCAARNRSNYEGTTLANAIFSSGA
jgi:hypothetical protein